MGTDKFLNEDFDIFKTSKNNKDSVEGSSSSAVIIDTAFSGKKKKHRKKIEIQQVEEPETNKIVIPKSIEQEHFETTIQQAKEHTQQIYDSIEKLQILQKAVEVAKTEGTLNVDEDLEDKVAETLEEISGNDMTDVNVVEVVATTTEALEEVPDVDLTLDDVEIKPSKTKKDKTGYFKTKVNIKKSNIPEIINKIATIVKQESNGIISPRVCDLRVIGNTNKTQLRGQELKLSAATVVFKPDFHKLKVNKGTRIMLSVPNGQSDKSYHGNLLVYVQESRAKNILEVSQKDFDSEQQYIGFLAKTISSYYINGYDVTLKRLQLRGTNNPLLEIMQLVVGTGDYKVKPVQDTDGHLYRFDVISKHDKNQWLRVIVNEVMQGTYRVYGLNELTQDEYIITRNDISLKTLSDNIISILNKSYERDWSKELKIGNGNDEIPEAYYMLDKLKHRKLRLVGNEIYIASVDSNNDEQPEEKKVFDYPVVDGIELLKTASRRDMIKLQKNDYDAEMIIGKTPVLDYFYLTYLAYPIIGGDRRSGREYITRDSYYQKYNVLDHNQYQKRKKTILEKEGNERNYNARIYLFQLEYSVNGVKNIYRAKTFKEIMDKTKFLSKNPDVTVQTPI